MLRDLKHALRILIKDPGLAIVAILTLGIGIAANSTVFGWIDKVLLRPLPGVAAGPELMAFETLAPNGEHLTTSYPDYRDYRDHLRTLNGLAAAQPEAFSIGDAERTERVWGELVSGNYFSVLGVKPIAGRVFSEDEYGDKQGGYPVAVISAGLWQSHYHGDPGIIGQAIRVNRQQLTVIGIVPEEFRGSITGLTFRMWVPAMMATQLNLMPDWMLRDRQTRSFITLARLKPGVSAEQSRSEIAGLAQRLGMINPETNRGISATLLPVWQSHFGAQALLLEPLRILMAVCGVVLLIVCANVANLLLSRATARQKEFGVRMSLGAGRARLAAQLLTESLVLAIIGALVAVPLAIWLGRSLGYLLPASSFPIGLEAGLNAHTLGFMVLLCVAACLLSGVAPAIHAARASLNDALKESGRSGTGTGRSQRVRGLLVISEVALAMVAITGAGLFARSFQLARQIHPGFDTHNVLVSRLYLSTAGYQVPERKLFCQRLRERLESEPGIAGAVYADGIPLGFGGYAWEDLQIEGYVPGPGENLKIYRNVVAPGYFDLLKIPLLEGRDFTERDDIDKLPVMIVNKTFVRRFFSGHSPLGRKVHGWGQWFTVAGVVKDSKYSRPNESPQPYFYVPFRQIYRADLGIAFYVRATGDINQALDTMRREVRGLDPNVAVLDAMPFAEYISASLYPQKVAAMLLGVLGAVSVLLAAIGLYSVMAYSVAQRTHEIGIRMALGAEAGDVRAFVVREGMALALVGLVAGMAIAFAVTRLASGLLINVSATDPLIFGGATALLGVITLAANYLPARRATKVDPNIALRFE